jgi:hypothetical protein
VSEGALPKSTIQADDHARLPPAPARPATARRRPAIPRITDAIIAEGLYELVRAADYAETRAWHVLAGGRLAGLVWARISDQRQRSFVTGYPWPTARL